MTLPLSELSERATQGPWQVCGVRGKISLSPRVIVETHSIGPVDERVAEVYYDPKYHIQHYADAHFIVASVNTIRLLLSTDEGRAAIESMDK